MSGEFETLYEKLDRELMGPSFADPKEFIGDVFVEGRDSSQDSATAVHGAGGGNAREQGDPLSTVTNDQLAGRDEQPWPDQNSQQTITPISPSLCSLFCRTRGGQTTLVGYPEFAIGPATSPPPRYLSWSWSGGGTMIYYQYDGCTGSSQLLNTYAQGGSCDYDAATGIQGATSGSYTNNGVVVPTIPPNTNQHENPWGVVASHTSDTAIVHRCGAYGMNAREDIDEQVTLSSPDTEGNAISRLLNYPTELPWSPWYQIGNGAPPCTTDNTDNPPDSCCDAQYESRGGIAFYYGEADWKITCFSLLPYEWYSTTIKYYRSLHNLNSYTLYQTVTVMEMTDGSGNLTILGSVPNDKGYDTYASLT